MSRALIKHIRLSPTKARLIAKRVQGMNAELAMASLKFMPNKGAKFIANAISSAVANGGFEANEVQVLSCRVDAASVLKRFQPRARGSASRIRKPNSHILVVVGKAEENAETAGKKANLKAKNSAANLANAKTAAAEKKTSPKAENSQKSANSPKNSAKAVNSSENSAKNSAAKGENSAKGVNSKPNSAPKAEKTEKAPKGEAKTEKAAKKPETTKED